MNKLRNTLLVGLAAALFTVCVACSGRAVLPTSTPTREPAYERQTQKERVTKHYLENLTDYREISVDEWSQYYPAGLIVITDSEAERKLRDKSLVPERVMVGNRYGSFKEYVKLKDTETGEIYLATIDALSGITEDVDSVAEITERIRNNEAELFASVLTDIENNTSPIPTTEKIIECENPYIVDTALRYVLKDVGVINFSSGEVSPFIDYNARLNSGKFEFEFSGIPEAATTYFLMDRLGVNYTIPFAEKEFGMIVGEKITEGKIYETPAGTKTNVKISYQPGSDVINVSGSLGDSVLTRITRYTYYSVKAGEALKAEEVQPPLKEYEFETTIDAKKALRAVGEYVTKKNREEEERQKQQREGTQQTLEELLRKSEEKISDIQKESEEQKGKLEQGVEKAKEGIQKGKKAICDRFPNLPGCDED